MRIEWAFKLGKPRISSFFKRKLANYLEQALKGHPLRTIIFIGVGEACTKHRIWQDCSSKYLPVT